MQTRQLGPLAVSVAGLGCNNFGNKLDAQGTAQVVHAALDAGVNFFDTADIYGGTNSEVFLGQALKGRRDSALIATKFGIKLDDARPGGGAPAYIVQAVEDSLRRLDTDHIDLYQIHRPDEDVPIADTIGAMQQLVAQGKVRAIGCSNFTVPQLQEARAAAGTGPHFVSVQNHYSLLHREPEQGVLAECAHQGIALLPYFPLANGLFTGKYSQGAQAQEGTRLAGERFAGWHNEANLAYAESLRQIAATHGHSLLELAFGWLLAKRVIPSVIAGATSAAQVTANAAAAQCSLSAAELSEIEAVVVPVQTE